jgi:hypothetical protein
MTTSLATKLGLRPQARSILIHAPGSVVEALSGVGATFLKRLSGSFDYIHAFVASQAELEKRLPSFKRHLDARGALWVSWRKGRSGREDGSDLSLSKVIETAYRHGLVESKTIGVNDTWSAIKLTFPKEGKTYRNSYGKLPS